MKFWVGRCHGVGIALVVQLVGEGAEAGGVGVG